MGRGTWDSKHAGEAEEMMVGVLAPKGAQDLTFECAALKLDFQKGRASGKRKRTDDSATNTLLTALNKMIAASEGLDEEGNDASAAMASAIAARPRMENAWCRWITTPR